MDRMSLPTSGTLLPAAGGMIHAMHGGGDGMITTQSVSMLPAAGGTIHAMHGGSGTLLPTAGGTIHAMSGGDGGFMQTKTGNSMIPVVNAPIHARSGGFKGGQRIITHLGESYTLETPPKERIDAKEPYPKDSNEYKILSSLGLEDLYKMDRNNMKGTQQEYDVLKAIYDGKCNLNSSLGSLANCEPIRRIIHTLALQLKTSIAFSMNIFNEADRAAANARRELQLGANESLAKAMQRGETEEEESNAARVLKEQEETAKAKLAAERAASELQKEEQRKRELASEGHLSEEDYARIAIAAMMIPSITLDEEILDDGPSTSEIPLIGDIPSASDESTCTLELVAKECTGTPDERKKQYREQALRLHPDKHAEDGCQKEATQAFMDLGNMKSCTGVKSASSVLSLTTNLVEEEEYTGEDDARITIAAMMPSMLSEESVDAKPDQDKPEDPFHVASIATVAAMYDPSSVPVPVALVEDVEEEELTGEDDARIAAAAMMALHTEPIVSVNKVESDAVMPVLEPEAVVQIPPSENVEPKLSYQERIGEIGTIIDENDPSTFQPEAYKLLYHTSISDERKGYDILFNRDETNPYYSSFLSKNSIYARTFMASYPIYIAVMKHLSPDHQFIADFNRFLNWTVKFPTDMLTTEERMQFEHITDGDDNNKMKIYEKWIQPVLKNKLTPDERAMFICFQQSLESPAQFVYVDGSLIAYNNRGGKVEKNGYEVFDKHIITLDDDTLLYRFVRILYRSDESVRYQMNNADKYVPETVLFSGTVHIDRKNYKQANDKTFVQFELFDFHNPFFDALQMQKVKSMVFTVKKHLQDPFYSKKSRPAVPNTSPLKQVNQREYQENTNLYHKHVLSSFIDFMSSNPIKDKEVLDAIKKPVETIQKSLDTLSADNMLDYDTILSLLNDIEHALDSSLVLIHHDFKKMVIRARSISEPLWNQVVDNVYFDKGKPNKKEKQLEPTNSLSNKQEQYQTTVKTLSKTLKPAQMQYDQMIKMDKLEQIVEKIKTFKSARQYPIFGKLFEWYNQHNIDKNYESQGSFHKKVLDASVALFDTDVQFTDAIMSYKELVSLYTILTQNGSMNNNLSESPNNESLLLSSHPSSPSSSPSSSPPSSPRSSPSQSLLNMDSLLGKLQALSSDPSSADLQPAALAVEKVIVGLDEDAAELAKLEAEEEAVAQPAAVGNIAISAIDDEAAASSSAAASINPSTASSAGISSESQSPSAMEVDSVGSVAAPAAASRKIAWGSNSESSNGSNSNSNSNNWASPSKPSKRPASVPRLALSSESQAPSATNSAVASSSAAEGTVASSSSAANAEVPFENGLIKPNLVNKGRKRTPQYNAIVKELNGLRGKHPKFLKNNNSPPVVQVPSNENLNREQSVMNGSFANQRNKKPNSQVPKKSFNQLFQNEMNDQEMIQKEERKRLNEERKRQNKEREKELQEELEHFGLNGELNRPLVSFKTNENDLPAAPAVEPAVASNNVPPQPAKPNTKFKSLAQHAEEAGVKPYVEPLEDPASKPAPKSIAPAPIVQAAPFKISKNLMKQQEAYQKQLNNDPAVQRARARIAAAKKAEANEKKKKENNMERLREEALAARKASEAKQASKSPSSNPFNPSSLQGAPPITKMNKAKAKKLEQIKLKVAMGQPLTKNEKAIYQSKGGTRKKVKQSRIQTRKRSTKRSSKRSTKRSKRNTRNKTK